ncbi:hypothetical protein [Gluconobacter morbifer]|uniref:Uncharacterized protein n=1 Tax=Gluconobacter morbifer G707 TaxID=1088869 RepID=G6XMD0_9PROT|nr:hypothetical protein [Gluconobacter morbifer]EHH67028.1 hypothetical protein GMO_26480 [Gluconobacter morbifer G707]
MTVPLLEGVRLDDAPVERLYPGWVALSRQPAAESFEAVVLQDEQSGRQACWWLENDSYVGSHVMVLEADVQNRLLTGMDPVFWPLAEGVLAGNSREDASRFVTDLAQPALNELTGAWLNRHAPHTILMPPPAPDNGDALTCPDGRVIKENRLKILLSSRRGSEALVVASPFSDLPLRAQLSMPVAGYTAYRFHDEAEQIVFYLIWNDGQPDRRPSFYYPQGPLLISEDPLGAFLPSFILGWYATHPDHAEAIRAARPFRPEDFGVGQASKRSFAKPDNTAPPPSDQKPDNEAPRPNEPPPQMSDTSGTKNADSPHEASEKSFLPPQPAPAQPSTPPSATNKGWTGRLKSLFRRT